ncbi:hypothetical protein [Bradyrhizobium tropiciagri]|uniref:hypothetical protein n=1 Tax=Bradyrhizobium tropiciagri TaxID=312253 RepID=UPI00067C18A9|nr:hypothetical protein [Bradyrhizobium tropiciagri]
MTMYGPGGPDPEMLEMRAQSHAQRAARKKHEFEKRIRENPNRFFLGDLRALWVPFLAVIVLASGLLAASILLPPYLMDWLANAPNKTRWIIVAAIFVGGSAWYVRERIKLKIYPVAEIAFGITLSVQGVVQQNPSDSHFTLFAALIAFVAGVRIIIDGFKRFDEFRTGWLFTPSGLRYQWRSATRFLRQMRYDQ